MGGEASCGGRRERLQGCIVCQWRVVFDRTRWLNCGDVECRCLRCGAPGGALARELHALSATLSVHGLELHLVQSLTAIAGTLFKCMLCLSLSMLLRDAMLSIAFLVRFCRCLHSMYSTPRACLAPKFSLNAFHVGRSRYMQTSSSPQRHLPMPPFRR